MAHITLSQLTTVLQRIVSWATGKFAAKNTYSGKLEYADMPVVVLASMGSELDGTSTQRPMSAGDTYYLPAGQGAGARIMFVDSIGTAVKISDPVSNVIYCNAYTGLLYRWDASESDMVSVGGDGDGLRKVYVRTNDFSSLDALNSAEASGVYQVIGQSSQKIIGILVVSSDNTPFIVTQWLFSALVLSDEFSGSLTGEQYANGRAHIIHRFYNASNSSSDIPLNTWSEWKVYGLTLDEMSEFLNDKQDTLTFDNAPTANSNNPVKSGGVYTALAGKQATLVKGTNLDATPTNGSDNPVTSDGVYDAIAAIPAGADGKSAYEIAQDNGYTGTEAEWIASLLPTVVSNGDMAIVEGDSYIDIFIYEPAISTSPTAIALDGEADAHKSATLAVTGSHLKADITVSVPTGFYIGATGTATSATLTATGGAVSESVVIRHSGSNPNTDITGAAITLTSGTLTKTVPLSYTRYAGPTILADSTLTIKAAAGQSNTGSLQVTGLNLTAGITATVSGTGFTVSASESGTYGNQASLPSSGGTLYVKFSPTGSTASTGTLTLESTGATSKTVDLTGAVSTLTVSPSSLSFSTEAGTPATKTFTVQGANLTQDISISASGTGFSVSPATIDKDNAGTAQTVTVTYSPSETGTNTGSITLQSGGATATVTLEGTASAGLPTGYTKLTYLQGITRQFQSPVVTYPQTWEFDVQCDALTSNIQILACASSAGGKWVGASNNGKWGVGITDATCTTVQVTTRATVTATLKSTGVEITIGNETITRNADSALTGYAFLFGCNETDKRLFGGKVYGVRLVSGGTADLVLASRDSDGQQGIYNLTNNTFYGLT